MQLAYLSNFCFLRKLLCISNIIVVQVLNLIADAKSVSLSMLKLRDSKLLSCHNLYCLRLYCLCSCDNDSLIILGKQNIESYSMLELVIWYLSNYYKI
jgi:hypothetical protein